MANFRASGGCAADARGESGWGRFVQLEGRFFLVGRGAGVGSIEYLFHLGFSRKLGYLKNGILGKSSSHQR